MKSVARCNRRLVDWTGRAIRNDKRGFIDNRLPPILKRLDIPTEQWLSDCQSFEAIYRRRFNRAVPTLNTG